MATHRQQVITSSLALAGAVLAGPAASARAETASPDAGVAEVDGGMGRALLTDTAVTLPAGAWRASVRSPVLPLASLSEVAYGVSDRVEISVGGALAVSPAKLSDSVGLPGAAIKVALWRRDRSVTSVSVGAGYLVDTGGAAVASVRHSACLDAACARLLTVGAGAVALRAAERMVTADSAETLYDLGASFSASLLAGRGRTRGVFEAVALIGTPVEFAGGYAGIRLARRAATFDLGLAGGATLEGDLVLLPMAAVAVGR